MDLIKVPPKTLPSFNPKSKLVGDLIANFSPPIKHNLQIAVITDNILLIPFISNNEGYLTLFYAWKLTFSQQRHFLSQVRKALFLVLIQFLYAIPV